MLHLERIKLEQGSPSPTTFSHCPTQMLSSLLGQLLGQLTIVGMKQVVQKTMNPNSRPNITNAHFLILQCKIGPQRNKYQLMNPNMTIIKGGEDAVAAAKESFQGATGLNGNDCHFISPSTKRILNKNLFFWCPEKEGANHVSSSCSPFLISLALYFSLHRLCSAFTLKVTQLDADNPSRDPYQILSHLVSSSLARAHRLKNPKSAAAGNNTATPLFSHSYGAYSISLSFGTPPQILPFVMDTGSDFVWFPCTHRYAVGCRNPKCSWVHHTNKTQCDECQNNPKPRKCTQLCPPYFILYGSGTTAGLALSETLNLGDRTVSNFLVGCSVLSSKQPAGIAGFGRGLPSLPSQLKLNKFSYCLISRRFDDSPRSSTLILDSASEFDRKTNGLIYTPFLKNPAVEGKEALQVYYYVGLRKITVGGRSVKVPYKLLSLGKGGDGGTIVDSGSTFTFMAREIFMPLATEFVKQVKNYSRARDVEVLTGLRPCFNVSDGDKQVEFPELRFHFKGGAEMALPLENYFAVVGDGVACLILVTDGGVGGGKAEVGHSGPAVVLGSFQMQNYYVEYDLRNERLGLKPQLCI
ncbi:hypothetical protein F3Y22_tig00110956pilonHSYRG00097 [Hibiscus syriacus]|uniref:Peptidase A1 domain-containing protein n=1 Tax=Hibiscus syriacus TaxID=106335 RepID=A0A6A2ZA03_HIBSY|nr:hypothetical protein F3Y22_tig00110956pilonHSYRG00097 [Hibiscus syriacus]